MKKILIPALMITLGLSACQKAEEAPAEPQAEAAAPALTTHSHDEHDHNDHAEHAHEHGEHAHSHDHAHDDGHHHHHPADSEKYQCGDKTIYIAVHNHDGDIEAHLTTDDITYDLEQDTQIKERFITDDSIAGDDKGMVLTIDGNTAKITTQDNTVITECIKAS
ncbi:hypothetical protein [Moraxella nonliquefaciens]|uniref:C-type lysozyme inhibitor domain-containing protein n=1 Tax=Moraxella nonliquefaciens TaxID=478 RepID=A0A1B8QS84_MORNO|nr:hypothetical protein [Moraxella nonliquefaciens]OBX87227.1 hypothetical protein A7456_08830 [Moraxella nonliquefaciens]QPT44145.1 hypothetical protein I6G26_08750 [Moraxella nonliquefaciens]QQC29164.1 hypothetical protein I6H63_07535 [Moraxella nonliquefaciens]